MKEFSLESSESSYDWRMNCLYLRIFNLPLAFLVVHFSILEFPFSLEVIASQFPLFPQIYATFLRIQTCYLISFYLNLSIIGCLLVFSGKMWCLIHLFGFHFLRTNFHVNLKIYTFSLEFLMSQLTEDHFALNCFSNRRFLGDYCFAQPF